MKKILTILAIALIAVGASGKKKAQNNKLVIDFTASNPLTAVQGETPEKISLNRPACGLEIPTKYVKDQESAEAAGYIYCPNDEKGEIGWYFPYSLQSFQYEGKSYEMVIGTYRTPGRKATLVYNKSQLLIGKPVFTFPKVEGKVPCGLKVTTVGNKFANERTIFRVCRNNIGRKNEIAVTNAPEKGQDSVLECTFEAEPEDTIAVICYGSFNITRIEFLYKPLDNGKKK